MEVTWCFNSLNSMDGMKRGHRLKMEWLGARHWCHIQEVKSCRRQWPKPKPEDGRIWLFARHKLLDRSNDQWTNHAVPARNSIPQQDSTPSTHSSFLVSLPEQRERQWRKRVCWEVRGPCGAPWEAWLLRCIANRRPQLGSTHWPLLDLR